MAQKTLLDLPDELLLELPWYMRNIEDFKNASSTCRRLYNVFANTLPKAILRLAYNSAPTFFSPHPHYLFLAVARQIAAWAVSADAERETRVARLGDAFRGGVKGVLSFALRDDVEGVGLTMGDIRRMYEARFNIINPLNATIDAMIGDVWIRQPNFWHGGVEDAFTLYTDSSHATFQLLIYGEFFGPTMASYLQPLDKRTPGLGIETRIEFIKYCIPDWICCSNDRNDGFKVLPEGPYADGAEDNPSTGNLEGNQTALAHLVGGAMFEGMLWKRAWRRVLIAAGAEKNDDGKWPAVWIKTLQRIKFKKARGIAKSSEETVDENIDLGTDNTGTTAEDGQSKTDASNEPGKENTEKEQKEEDKDDEDAKSSSEQSEDWLYDSISDTEPTVNSTRDYWRFFLFWNALTQTGGLHTMQMVAQFKGCEDNRDATIAPEWKLSILRLRDQALALGDQDRPGFKEFGRRTFKISEAPDLGEELHYCCAGLWGGY
jgi:hypothetical protein